MFRVPRCAKSMIRLSFSCALALAAVGCGDVPVEGDAMALIGEPDPDNELDYLPLYPGDEVRLGTSGQGGYHAFLAVRTQGLGNRAFIDIEIENLDTGETISTLPSARPSLLLCRDGDIGCDQTPIYVMLGGLAAIDSLEGLPVEVRVTAFNGDGGMATSSLPATLRMP